MAALFSTFLLSACSASSPSMNNPLVRIYAKYVHSQFRKKHIRPFSRIFQTVNDKFNIFIINANGEFYKLSDDEKELLKTLFELMF
jgi:hypothetical protein